MSARLIKRVVSSFIMTKISAFAAVRLSSRGTYRFAHSRGRFWSRRGRERGVCYRSFRLVPMQSAYESDFTAAVPMASLPDRPPAPCRRSVRYVEQVYAAPPPSVPLGLDGTRLLHARRQGSTLTFTDRRRALRSGTRRHVERSSVGVRF